MKNKKQFITALVFLLVAGVIMTACMLLKPQPLSKVCGEFWEAEAVFTYASEENPEADALYTVDGTVRLSEYLSNVRIGTAHAEKKVAINPDWSTLYLSLTSADGTDARHLTIDFVLEHDTLVSPEAIYSLNIGTRDDSKSYKVLSGQEEIDAFLAYLRGETPDAPGFIQWCDRFRSENVTNLSISVDGAAALGYTGTTLKSMASELEPLLRASTEEQRVQLPDADAFDSTICLMIGDNKDDYMINLSADGNYANTLHVLGAFRADEEGTYFRPEAYYDAPWIASWIRATAIPLLEGDLPEATLSLEEETHEDDGVSQTVKSIQGEFPGGTRLTVGTFELSKGAVTFSGAWSPSYASVCAIVKPSSRSGDGAVIYFKPGESISLDFGQSGSYDIVLLAPKEGIDGTMQIAMPWISTATKPTAESIKASAVSSVDYGGYLWYIADGYFSRYADGKGVEQIYKLPLADDGKAPVVASVSVLAMKVALSYHVGKATMGQNVLRLFDKQTGEQTSEVIGYGSVAIYNDAIIKTTGFVPPEPDNLRISRDGGKTWENLGDPKYLYGYEVDVNGDGTGYSLRSDTQGVLSLNDGWLYITGIDTSSWNRGGTQIPEVLRLRVNLDTGKTVIRNS